MAGNSKAAARAHLADAGVEALPDDWDVVTLGDLFTEDRGIAVGVMYPGDHVPDGVPLIKAGDLNGSIINPQPDFRISKEKHHEYRRTALEGGELLMTLVGNVGQCAVVPPRMAGWNTARAVAVMRLAESSETQFVQQCLLSRPLQHLMNVWCNTTVQATLNLKEIRQLPLPWPPKQSRDAIAEFGKALDDKIELNRRMNATLEAMARAMFQSWFVDFDPVRAKLDGRQPAGLDSTTAALFPATFQDSTVGHIPQGWKVSALDELTSFVIGGDWGATEPTDDETVSCYCIRGADIPSLQSGGVGKMPTRFLKSSSVEKRQLKNGDLAIEISGGSPTQCTGRPVLASDALLRNLGKPLVASNFCRIVKLKSPALSKFVYLWLRRLYDAGELFQFETGTTGIKNFAFVIFAERYPLVVPDLRIAEAFDRAVSPLFARIQANAHESRTLATLRDTLLPKLLSGELSVAYQTRPN